MTLELPWHKIQVNTGTTFQKIFKKEITLSLSNPVKSVHNQKNHFEI